MLVFNQFVLFFVVLIVLQVSAEHGFKPSITCYMKYDHEETKSQTLNTLLGYSYHQSEITQYATTEGEPCLKVGCGCFSYKASCSHPSPGANHFSQCTEEDRRNGVTKWHRGWASHTQCEQMRKHPHTYDQLTCCYTDRCNDQPGKITKVVDTELPLQQYDTYAYKTPEPLSIVHKSSPRHHSHVHTTTTSHAHAHAHDKHKPTADYDRSSNNSFSPNSFSNWMIFFALAFCFLIMI